MVTAISGDQNFEDFFACLSLPRYNIVTLFWSCSRIQYFHEWHKSGLHSDVSISKKTARKIKGRVRKRDNQKRNFQNKEWKITYILWFTAVRHSAKRMCEFLFHRSHQKHWTAIGTWSYKPVMHTFVRSGRSANMCRFSIRSGE